MGWGGWWDTDGEWVLTVPCWMLSSVRKFPGSEMSPLGLGCRSWGGHTAGITVPDGQSLCPLHCLLRVTALALLLTQLSATLSSKGVLVWFLLL